MLSMVVGCFFEVKGEAGQCRSLSGKTLQPMVAGLGCTAARWRGSRGRGLVAWWVLQVSILGAVGLHLPIFRGCRVPRRSQSLVTASGCPTHAKRARRMAISGQRSLSGPLQMHSRRRCPCRAKWWQMAFASFLDGDVGCEPCDAGMREAGCPQVVLALCAELVVEDVKFPTVSFFRSADAQPKRR